MAAKKKFYVVWEGKVIGIYDNWETCKNQVWGVEGAKYKAFDTMLEAEKAFREGYESYYRQQSALDKTKSFQFLSSTDSQPVLDSLAVDAACNMVTKQMEYRGVYTRTQEVWFHQGPFQGATNNIGEFLALVHGLALLKQYNKTMPIYSDSVNAIAWVRAKKCRTKLARTEKNIEVFNLIARAERWLEENHYTTQILKWDTPNWGEIPADFGRK
jgi:ribonuclease HI